ncbi:bifunctional hydroxymethylpyrimidine kinase/phosphomethylpyrimidine kinase [Geofilum sp. OHC36d9]|uniref:bifunctional hydroxymethylpyrimidine kinase/phosphomethylpyrimidine kinase n=1 Tax=Geofilum sp. OHC36d9 TaxID=3458413 RepID=UPI004033BB83
MNYKRVLTIAGSDPSGGAGIQADLKTISACGCYGTSAITAVVNENTVGVFGLHPIPVDFVKGQIKSVLDDIGTDAIKIGMLHSANQIMAVIEAIMPYNIRNIVLDPVMLATSGDTLLMNEAIVTLKNKLMPMARVITPNIPEAEILSGESIRNQSDLPKVVKKISCNKTVSVLLKAGHLNDETLIDIFYNAETDEIIELPSQRINTHNTHGTGCTLSSAIASFLAQQMPLNRAVTEAKSYINQAIETGKDYHIGKGHGPVHHFYKYWK